MAKFDKEAELTELRRRSKRPIFQIFDGNQILHRALHTRPPHKNKEGVEIGAVGGALSLICSEYSLLQPTYVALTFDVPGRNFRHSLSDNYKFNDPAVQENKAVNTQLYILVRLMQLVGFPVLFIQGIEADDVLGALATQSQDDLFEEPVNTVLMTGDKDLGQFIGPHVICCDTKETGAVMTANRVIEKFGVPPPQIADYLALMGDANDGVAGLPGCGPQKARQLLNEFGGLHQILNIKPGGHGEKWKKMLTATNMASLRRDYALTRIRTDVAVSQYGPFQLRGCHPRYLQQALHTLDIKAPPSLVQAQLTMAALGSDSLFDDNSEQNKPLVEDSKEWDGLMGCLWKSTDLLASKATFKE